MSQLENARILICIPCHNRRAIVEQCIPTVADGMRDGDELHIYDDGSSEYGREFLMGLGADSIVTTAQLGIEQQRRRHFLDFSPHKFTHLYLTDSDAPHDTHWRSASLQLQRDCGGAPVCLYDTVAHSDLIGNTIEDRPDSNVIWRRVAPGISYLLTREHVEVVCRALPYLPDHWNWDWTVPALLGNRFAVSATSYCDHIGGGGLHHPEGAAIDEGDRATNPTAWLVAKRAEIVEKLRRAP